jgi:hypothetical protein
MIPRKKLQVFVSSTYEDLKEERQAAVEAILSAGHIPAGMELFAAGDEPQMQVIRDWIEGRKRKGRVLTLDINNKKSVC